MVIVLELAALNLTVALTCGAVIGSERQIRQRMAGLRTNALVALGAAGFVIFSSLYPAEVSPTRVAAQIVSGIGFLGAGIIFRDGFNVHGLNTAATLWCSAGVGMMAGSGALDYAALMTVLVVFVNLGLRPLVKWIKRKTNAGAPVVRQFKLCVTGPSAQEVDLRGLVLRTLGMGALRLSEMQAEPVDGGGMVRLTALIMGEGLVDHAMEQALSHLAADPLVRQVTWQVLEDV